MRKKVVKKADLNTTAGRYFLAKQKGMTKKEAALQVGILPNNTPALEATAMYKAIEKKYFKDELLATIEMGQIAQELKKNIIQDDDRGAKNKAIEIALDRLEPDATHLDDEIQRMVVIIK